MDEYVKRLQFLKELWPEEHLSLLGPRAALLVEGAAFQKVSRIAPDKLKSPDGVKILAEQLGGTWGRLQVEDKFHYFEQAIYQTQQKHEETNDSYIARHDAQFEELLSRKVQLEEIRAYILLRHSQLAPEDKKRAIVEPKGDLKYAETIKAIKLLGSRFFGELQNRNGSSAGTSRGQERNKVYDVNMTEADDSEEINMATYDEEVDEDEAFAYFFEQCDQDALYIAEFEDGIITRKGNVQRTWTTIVATTRSKCPTLRPSTARTRRAATIPTRSFSRTCWRTPSCIWMSSVSPTARRERESVRLEKEFKVKSSVASCHQR